jgi:hypothetical protein
LLSRILLTKISTFNFQPYFLPPKLCRFHSSEQEEIHISNALEAYKSGQIASIQAAASHFGVSKWKLGKGRTATEKVLNPSQEASLIRCIELLNSVYKLPTAFDIEGAANRILRYCGSDRQVSKMYGYQFIQRLPPHITLRTQKPMEKELRLNYTVN